MDLPAISNHNCPPVARTTKYPRVQRNRLLIFLAILCVISTAGSITLTALFISQDVNRSGSSRVITSNSKINSISPKTRRVLKNRDVDVCVEPDCVTAASRILQSIDSLVDPCDNFFEYACGKWNLKHVIPDSTKGYTMFTYLRDEVAVQLKGILEEELKSQDPIAVKKMKTFYQSCMSEEQITRAGIETLRTVIQELGGWPVLKSGKNNSNAWNETSLDFLVLLAKLKHYMSMSVIAHYVGTDNKNSDVNIIRLDKPGLGMSAPYIFLKKGEELDTYTEYAENVAVAFGADRDVAKRDMRNMVEFEIQLANISIPLRNRPQTHSLLYKKITVGNMSSEVPNFNWLRFLQLIFEPANVKITKNDVIGTTAVEFLSRLIPLLAATNNRVLANYAIWRFIMDHIKDLGKPHRMLQSDFNKVLYGLEQEPSWWKVCVKNVDKHMGNVVGRKFIDKYFDHDAKDQALSMVSYIRNSFIKILDQADWMSNSTRKFAKGKVESIEEKIGYADFVMNYTALADEVKGMDPKKATFLSNVLESLKMVAISNLKSLRQPVEKTKWVTSPATVNAYFNTPKNQILFPAGILQPPLYKRGYLKSLNFGGIGMVIGHEITHGFDNRGRLYDKHGNLKDWWTEEDQKGFKHRAQCIIDQYSNFTVSSINLNVNGILTLGENIADNEGIKQAFMGYRDWIKKENNGQEEPRLPGLEHFTNNQLFFINAAATWCGSMRPEAAAGALRSNQHSPGHFRIIGSLQNLPEFAETFNCSVGTRMNPKKKCRVW